MPRKKIEPPDTLEPEVPAESVAVETNASAPDAETTTSAKAPADDKPKPRKPRKKKEPVTPEPSVEVDVPTGTSLENALEEIVKSLGDSMGGEGTGSDESRPDVPEIINILPLRDSVIYPMLIAPLSVSRESGVQLIDESVVGNNREIGVVAQRQPQEENPNFDDVFE